MTAYDELAQRYIDTWNQTDPSARHAAVDQLYTEDARYVDPLGVADGREAIASMIGAVQQQFPGFSFRLAGPVDGHHNQARFGWELGPAGSPAPIVGFDVAVSDDSAASRPCWGSSTRFRHRERRPDVRRTNDHACQDAQRCTSTVTTGPSSAMRWY